MAAYFDGGLEGSKMLGSRFSSGKLEVVSMEGWMSNEQVVERMKRVRRLKRPVTEDLY